MAQQDAEPGDLNHLNQNSTAKSLVLFVIFFAFFLGGVYVLSYASLDNIWPFIVSLVLITISFWVPLGIMGRSDTGAEMVDTDHRKPNQGH
ncbi:hypothetical protein [Acaricomes phytoseiuli]|uniref:hypothetical protein n=1 Tax=Acaricomes phytoseiuli TaxID=291968 RepID=UPI0003601126|nr:hypothetical protein [Acaricomes phytoseiuli]